MAKGQRRDPRREAFWRDIVAQFAQSGLSVREFCRRRKLTESAFYAWRRVIRQRAAEGQQPAFVPVVVRPEASGEGLQRTHGEHQAGIAVKLAGGRVLRLPGDVTAQRLAELVGAVESVPVERSA